MVADAGFWVVPPRVTFSGVSGLGTLLSGNYIGFERGKSQKEQRRFNGLEVPPAVTIDRPGLQLQLTAADMGSLGIGSPLKSEISRTVAENLVLMLGTDRVTQAAPTANPGTQYRALIEVQRLESMPGESVAFEAVWILRRTGDGKSLSGRTRVREPLSEPGYGAVAAAHSRAVGRLSQDIADAVRSLEAAPR